MQNNPWLLIFVIGIIALFVGYLIGVIGERLSDAKGGRENPGSGDPAEEGPPKLDEHNVLKVTVDPALKWYLELDGVRLEPDGLTAEQRTRLVNVLIQVRPWVEGKVLAPTPAAPAPGLAATALTPSTPLDVAPVRLNADSLFSSALKVLDTEVKTPPPPPPPTIVGMIDQVLQKKLEGSPLAEKQIRLEEGDIGEVVVFIGLTRYSGIDAVPDEDIKTIIRESIAEWDSNS